MNSPVDFLNYHRLKLQVYFRGKRERHRTISSIGSANETVSSIVTTPDPLNTAFVGVNMIYLIRNNHSYCLFIQNRRLITMNSVVKEVHLNNNKVNLK